MDPLYRIRKTINWLIFKEIGVSEKDIAEKLGYTKSSFSQIVNGKVPLSDKFIKKISSLDENINFDWVLSGEGNMFKTNDNNMTNQNEPESVYLLPVSAHGGTLSEFVLSVKERDCEKIISPIKDADFAISVYGDSMAPEYPSGSQVLIKRIDEKAFIDWGKTYVLDTCNGVVIKKIFPPDDKSSDKLKCVSTNPEYPPFDVKMIHIYGIYKVMLCMAQK